jgi:hypothetical protein
MDRAVAEHILSELIGERGDHPAEFADRPGDCGVGQVVAETSREEGVFCSRAQEVTEDDCLSASGHQVANTPGGLHPRGRGDPRTDPGRAATTGLDSSSTGVTHS